MGGEKKSEAEVARMAEAERAANRLTESDAESAGGSAAAVVAGLAAEALKLD